MAALEGKTAIVTGASSGIGAATAAALAREGARVAGGARRIDELQTEIRLELDRPGLVDGLLGQLGQQRGEFLPLLVPGAGITVE